MVVKAGSEYLKYESELFQNSDPDSKKNLEPDQPLKRYHEIGKQLVFSSGWEVQYTC